MTTLSKLIEALKTKESDQHGVEYSAVVDLNARLTQHDEAMLREIDFILESHEVRRAEIRRKLELLANRVGSLPPPAEHHPQPLESEPFVAPRYLNQHPADDAIDDIHRPGVLQ